MRTVFFLIGFTLGMSSLSFGLNTIVKPYTFSSDTTAESAQVNSNFDTVYSGANLATGVLNQAAGSKTTLDERLDVILNEDGTAKDFTVGTITGNLVGNATTATTATSTGNGGGSISTNLANGYQALHNTYGGGECVALGVQAMHNNTTGAVNTAVGYTALNMNTIGTQNTALGAYALQANTTGQANVGVGVFAGSSTQTAHYNTAVGSFSLFRNMAQDNSAVGAFALYNATGGYQTGIGSRALFNVTSGSNNIALGYNSGSDSMLNVTSQSNQLVLGNNSITNATIKVALTVVSDERDKTNFGSVPHGLDFISKLNPISYKYKVSREDDTPTGITRYGFKAQDIMKLEGDNPVIIDASDPNKLKLTESSLIPVLVNAIKDLKKEIDTLKSSTMCE